MKNQINFTRGIRNYKDAFAQANAEEQKRLEGCKEYLGEKRFDAETSKINNWCLVDGLVYYIYQCDTGEKVLHRFEPTFSSINSNPLYRIVTNRTIEESVQDIIAESKGEEVVVNCKMHLQTPREMKAQFRNWSFKGFTDEQMDQPCPLNKSGDQRKIVRDLRWLVTSDSDIFFKFKGVDY